MTAYEKLTPAAKLRADAAYLDPEVTMAALNSRFKLIARDVASMALRLGPKPSVGCISIRAGSAKKRAASRVRSAAFRAQAKAAKEEAVASVCSEVCG